MTSSDLLARRQLISAERLAREDQTLSLIGRRFTTSELIVRRTGWTERSVQRYVRALESRGLITLTRDSRLGVQGVWFWRYALTDAGKRAIAVG